MNVDVVIVGAGPVGVTAANLLGRTGARVLIVDRERDVMPLPRAIGLDDEGSRVLDDAGLLAGFAPQLRDVDAVALRSPARGELLRFGVGRFRNGYPYVRTFHQPTLERHLRAGLGRFAGVELALGTRCERLDDVGDAVRVELRGDAGARAVTARFALGCDGAHSFVRRAIGVDMAGVSYEQPWLVVDVERCPWGTDDFYFDCDRERPSVTMPAPGGRRRWEFMLRPGDTRESMTDPATVRRLLARHGDPDAMGIERAAVYNFDARVASRMQRGNVYLLGDAAHLTPPFAGQGLMAGLRDAANISWKIGEVVAGRAPRALVDSYEVERRDNVRTMVALARIMGAMIMPTSPRRARARDAILCAVRALPGVSALFGDLHVKPCARIRRGLVARGGLRPSRAVGAPFPRLRIAGDGGATTDELHTGRWAIIGVGASPADHLTAHQQRRWRERGALIELASDGAAATPAGVTRCQLDEPLPAAWRRPACYVVRPDHVVYAAVAPARLDTAVAGLSRALAVSPRERALEPE